MNKQEIFDTVVNHLRQQGKRAYNDSEQMCMYRGPDGTKCAAGVFITDEEYRPDLEGKTITALITSGPFSDKYYLPKLAALIGKYPELVLSLQSVHDQASVENWENMLFEVANRFGLVYNPPMAPRSSVADEQEVPQS